MQFRFYYKELYPMDLILSTPHHTIQTNTHRFHVMVLHLVLAVIIFFKPSLIPAIVDTDLA